jgi:hypothetical protein
MFLLCRRFLLLLSGGVARLWLQLVGGAGQHQGVAWAGGATLLLDGHTQVALTGERGVTRCVGDGGCIDHLAKSLYGLPVLLRPPPPSPTNAASGGACGYDLWMALLSVSHPFFTFDASHNVVAAAAAGVGGVVGQHSSRWSEWAPVCIASHPK